MKKIRKSNPHISKSISAAMLWIACAVRMAVLQYGYGIEYDSVVGMKLKGMRDSGCSYENPEQNLRSFESNYNPTPQVLNLKTATFWNHNPTTASFTHKNRNRNQASQSQPCKNSEKHVIWMWYKEVKAP